MSQELTDAEWLANLIKQVESDVIRSTALWESDLARLRSIADRLERPGVEELVGNLYAVNYGGLWGVECMIDPTVLPAILGTEPVRGMPLKVAIRPEHSVTPAATDTEPTAKA